MKNTNPYQAQVNIVLAEIRRIRMSRRYSQSDMAVRLSLLQNAYSKMELGHTSISLERLFQICEILEINVEDLFNAAQIR